MLDTLLKLQQLDDDLLEKNRRQKEIPQQIQSGDQDFEDSKQELETQQRLLKEAVARQRSMEKDLQESTDQLGKKQARKFDVKSNSEYKALLKEIEFTEQTNSKREDEILLLFEEIDTLEKSIQAQKQVVKEKEERVRQGKERLEQEVSLLGDRMDELLEQRKSVSRVLEDGILQEYEKIRTQRHGQAVVVINSNVCPACHLRVPPQTINEVLQTGEIRHCPHCLRILYCVLQEESA